MPCHTVCMNILSRRMVLSSLYVVLSLIALFTSTNVEGKPEIVQPYPSNIYPFENEEAQVTCIVIDTTGAKPYGIAFFRVGRFGDVTPIPDEGKSGRTYYQSRTEDDGKKLFTTLHFKKVVPNDDSTVGGRYECRGNSSGSISPFGFSVTVIRDNEIPTAIVKGATITIGASANLTCDVTNPLSAANQIKQLTWAKNSKVLERTLNSEKIEPVTISNATVKDGGDYVCAGLISFRSVIEKNITFGAATLKLKLKIEEGVTKKEAMVSESVTMECPADGYPMNVTWWRRNEEGKDVRLKMGERYIPTRACSYCHYALTITNVQLRDSGGYACHVNNTIGSGKHLFQLSVIPANENATVFPTIVDTEIVTTPSDKSSAMMYYAQSTILLLSHMVTWLLV